MLKKQPIQWRIQWGGVGAWFLFYLLFIIIIYLFIYFYFYFISDFFLLGGGIYYFIIYKIDLLKSKIVPPPLSPVRIAQPLSPVAPNQTLHAQYRTNGKYVLEASVAQNICSQRSIV